MNEENNSLIPVESTALREITAAEVDMQITTAKRYPRDLKKVRMNALSLATQDQEIARSCFYVLRRGQKNIEGPGVRLAEIIASQWGNLRITSRVVEVGATVVRAQGLAHDLESNVAYSNEVSVRITDKYGKRYSEDMIVVSGNAACAKALRNVTFKAVPFAYIKPIYEAAKKTAVGDTATLNDRKNGALGKFKSLGVSQEQLVSYLDVNSWEDVGLYELETLIGTVTSLEDGSSTVAELFNKKPVNAEKPKDEPQAPNVQSTEPVPPDKGNPASKEKPKAKRGRPKKEKPAEKPADPPTETAPATNGDPGSEEPPESATAQEAVKTESGQVNYVQQYNRVKAKLCVENGTEGTNAFIIKILAGRELANLTPPEWIALIKTMEDKLESE